MKTLLLVGLLIQSLSAYAQQTPKDIIDKFFKTYQTDPGKAIKEMYTTNVWTERVKDDIESIANKLDGFTLDYVGKYYGYELITSKQFSGTIELYSYLIRYDRQPLRFTFKFYKPNDKWMLYAFQYDDSLIKELEEAAKLHNLNLN